MDIILKYQSFDGIIFDDPYECEKHEKFYDKFPNSIGYFLNILKDFKETDYFAGIVHTSYKDKHTVYIRTHYDLSDIYEGEVVTSAMREVQDRVSSTVGDVLRLLKDLPRDTVCGGTFLISSTPDMQNSKCFHMDFKAFYEAVKKGNEVAEK